MKKGNRSLYFLHLLCLLSWLGGSAWGAEQPTLSASPSVLSEGSVATVTLSASVEGAAAESRWRQVAGPKVPLSTISATVAVADVSALEVAAECDLVFELTVVDADGNSSAARLTVPVQPADIVQYPAPHVQIGGASTGVARFLHGAEEWCLFNVGTALKATPVRLGSRPLYQIVLPGFVRHLTVVAWNGGSYAVASLGEAGVALIDLNDPASLRLLNVVPVNYRLEDVTFAEGGGSILYGNLIESSRAPIVATVSDGQTLYLADAEFGIHKTTLANLFDDVREADGTLFIEQERATIQYAGERPWGGPQALKLFGNRLFVPLDLLGLGIFDPQTLEQVGRYNLYTDTARQEDYFGAMDVAQAVARDPRSGEPYLDPFTGLPDYRQVNFEIRNASKGKNKNAELPHPWADLEREARWYYQAIDVDVARQGSRTLAYLAYSLGGVVAVDVSGCDTATAEQFLHGRYLGFFPAVPANGPDETGSQPASLLPYEGAGKLKESGVRAVRVQGERLYLSDHFAGLVVLAGADHPETWHGLDGPFNNDSNGIAGDHLPPWENVTSYDMGPNDPLDNESLPKAFFQAPCLLATAELNGHGLTLALREQIDPAAGTIDLLECSGGGGFVFVDLKDFSAPKMADRFAIVAYEPPTAEIGAAPDGSPTQTISIGHTAGVSVANGYLYVADGPHGVTAWQITDASGYPTDEVHLVANTVQNEYPVTVAGETVYPPSHAVRVVAGPQEAVWALCARNGLRRVPVAAVAAGQAQVGAPLLLKLGLPDLYEHNNEVANIAELNFQDHAYDAVFADTLAFVADGGNGLTVYDVSKDPSVAGSGFFVGNLGTVKTQPLFGKASAVELWQNPADGRRYALIAAGPYGVGVADVTDPRAMQVVKVFEPIKYEDGDVGSADGKASDVKVVGDRAYFAYDSFGLISYALADLIAPVPAGVSPTELFKKSNRGIVEYDHRPVALGRFKLQEVPGYEAVSGGAIRLAHTSQGGRLYFYAAFGEAGVIKVDVTDPAEPLLLERADTAGECQDIAIANGRLFVADGAGGLVLFK